MDLKWKDGFSISVRIDNIRTDNITVVLSANREGLLSLAEHMMELANESTGSHIHLDEYNSLEDGSAELIIEKTDMGSRK